MAQTAQQSEDKSNCPSCGRIVATHLLGKDERNQGSIKLCPFCLYGYGNSQYIKKVTRLSELENYKNSVEK